jgi:hypothetical protein
MLRIPISTKSQKDGVSKEKNNFVSIKKNWESLLQLITCDVAKRNWWYDTTK